MTRRLGQRNNARCAVLALPLMLCAASPSLAGNCPGLQVEVTADAPDLTHEICTMAATALQDMAACYVVLADPVEIAIVEKLPNNCLGLNHCDEARIELLPLATLSDRRDPDGLFAPVPDLTFRFSILVHELVHAAYENSAACPFESCPVTSEYLAYAMQIRSLPGHIRREITGTDFKPVSFDMFSKFLLFMAPDVFARDAWLHFSRRSDPCLYAGQIMKGDIVFDRERP